jgi:hypothetical protein
MKINKNKKAQFELAGAIPGYFAYIIWVLVILVFILLFSIKGCLEERAADEILKGASANSDIDIVLMNYLRTPVTRIKLEGKNIADLIVLRARSSLYDDELKEESEKILTPVYKDPDFWKIEVVNKNDVTEFQFFTKGYVRCDVSQESSQSIPNTRGDYYIVKLTKCKG